METKKLVAKIGIDKCTLYNIEIYPSKELAREISYKYTTREQIMHVKNPYVINGDGYMFEIHHHYLSEKYGSRWIYCGTNLTMWIVSDTGNLNNQTLKNIWDKLNWVKKDILQNHRLSLSFRSAKCSKLEVNATFTTPHEYAYYEKTLDIIQKLMTSGNLTPYTYGSNDPERKRSKTVGLRNKSQEFVIYDKAKQLTEKKKPKGKKETGKAVKISAIDQPIMRAEWTLGSPKKIKERLGTNSLKDLSDDILKKAYIKYFPESVLSRMKKFEATDGKRNCKKLYLSSLIKGEKNNFDTSAFSMLFMDYFLKNSFPPFFDIDDMQDVFTRFEKKNRNIGRTIKGIKQFVKKIHMESIMHQAREVQDILDCIMRCADYKDSDEGIDIGITYADDGADDGIENLSLSTDEGKATSLS